MKKFKRFDESHKQWMKDKEYRKAYAASEDKFALVNAIIGARVKAGLSQKQLARRMKMTHIGIIRMEGGYRMSSPKTMLRLAKATGTKLRIQFVEA